MKNIASRLFWTAALLLLIFYAQNTLRGAADGIELVLRSVIPSIFPFLIVSRMVLGSMTDQPGKTGKFICRLLRISPESQKLLAVGILGGYPIGAKLVADYARLGAISDSQAKRLMYFCCTAGPSFLFGVLQSRFSLEERFILWLIQILSLCGTAVFLPGDTDGQIKLPTRSETLQQVMLDSVKTMGLISGWIILFRIVLENINRIGIDRLPVGIVCAVYSAIELTQGLLFLDKVPQDWLRFCICGCALSFGGLCVWMQVHAVCKGLYFRCFAYGKIIQSMLSLVFCYAYCKGRAGAIVAIAGVIAVFALLLQKGTGKMKNCIV